MLEAAGSLRMNYGKAGCGLLSAMCPSPGPLSQGTSVICRALVCGVLVKGRRRAVRVLRPAAVRGDQHAEDRGGRGVLRVGESSMLAAGRGGVPVAVARHRRHRRGASSGLLGLLMATEDVKLVGTRVVCPCLTGV